MQTAYKTAPANFAGAALIFVWAFLRQLPVALADTHLGGDWTKLGKALTCVGGLLTLVGARTTPDADAFL